MSTMNFDLDLYLQGYTISCDVAYFIDYIYIIIYIYIYVAQLQPMGGHCVTHHFQVYRFRGEGHTDRSHFCSQGGGNLVDNCSTISSFFWSYAKYLSGNHYDDVIMTTLASQITSLAVVYSIVYSGVDQRKHQSSASLAFVWGSHRDRWIPRTKGQ